MTRAAGAALGVLPVALVVAACNGGVSDSGSTVRNCGGVSAFGLASETTDAGTCPSKPSLLTGKGTAGSQCASAADCAPVCCSCAGSGGAAAVAQCNGGNCLDASTTCCLYALSCG